MSTILFPRFIFLNITKLNLILVIEVVMPNRVTIHNLKNDAVDTFSRLIKEYLNIWDDIDFTNLLMDNLIKIPVQLNWISKISKKPMYICLEPRIEN